jgi:hypothetical protein
MAKNSPLNIFSATAKSKNSSSANTKAVPAAPAQNIAVEAMLERMNEMRKDIDDKLESLMYTSGLSKDRMQQYLSNPQNFSKEQWEFLQQKNQEFSDKIWNAVGSTIEVSTNASSKNIEATSTYDGPSGPASTAALPGRKSKFSGSRRNWIPTN